MRRGWPLAALLLAGCSLEPHYARPTAPVPPEFPTGPAYATPVDSVKPELHWRDLFRDPSLKAIIEQSLTNSRDLRVALANVEAARAQYRIQRSDQFPQIGATGGVTLSRSSRSGVTTSTSTGSTSTGSTGSSGSTGGTTGSTTTTSTTSGSSGHTTAYSIGGALSSFEIDLFGRLRSLTHSAFDEYLATAAGARAARLTLVSGVAEAYFQLAADRSALAVAQETVKSAERSVQLTDRRRAGGIAPRSDVDQAKNVLETARADAALYTTAVAQDRNALDLIAGSPVADSLLPKSIEAVDGLVGEVPSGISSAVLLRRPDVIQAELQLKAANARIGAARAEFFPTISLTGALGFASTALSSLFSGDAFHWSAGAGAAQPIFDGGRRAGDLAYAKAQRDSYLAQYELAIQTAFRETADALARRGTIDAQLAAVRRNEEASEDSYKLADARYREGVATFLDSLDAQRTLYSVQQNLAATRLTRARALVTLYQALGGDELTDPDRSALP